LGTMVAIVTTEAAGRGVVPDIVGMCTPGNLHRWENIGVINADQSFGSSIDLGLCASQIAGYCER